MTKRLITTDSLKLLDDRDSDEELDGENYEDSDDFVTESENKSVADDSVDHSE